jgi:hypothetical protein
MSASRTTSRLRRLLALRCWRLANGQWLTPNGHLASVVLAVTGTVLPCGSDAASAQRAPVAELGAGAVTTWARRDFAGVGVSLGYRPAAGGPSRIALVVAGGSLAGESAVRAEATAQYVLNPWARTGVTVYGAAGTAFVGAPRIRGAGYLTVFLGLETAATRRLGWFTEAGVGGGWRFAAGVRRRRFGRGVDLAP